MYTDITEVVCFLPDQRWARPGPNQQQHQHLPPHVCLSDCWFADHEEFLLSEFSCSDWITCSVCADKTWCINHLINKTLQNDEKIMQSLLCAGILLFFQFSFYICNCFILWKALCFYMTCTFILKFCKKTCINGLTVRGKFKIHMPKNTFCKKWKIISVCNHISADLNDSFMIKRDFLLSLELV